MIIEANSLSARIPGWRWGRSSWQARDAAPGRPGAYGGHFYPDRIRAHQRLFSDLLLFEGQLGRGAAVWGCMHEDITIKKE